MGRNTMQICDVLLTHRRSCLHRHCFLQMERQYTADLQTAIARKQDPHFHLIAVTALNNIRLFLLKFIWYAET
jgi:hypothetical protein